MGTTMWRPRTNKKDKRRIYCIYIILYINYHYNDRSVIIHVITNYTIFFFFFFFAETCNLIIMSVEVNNLSDIKLKQRRTIIVQQPQHMLKQNCIYTH